MTKFQIDWLKINVLSTGKGISNSSLIPDEFNNSTGYVCLHRDSSWTSREIRAAVMPSRWLERRQQAASVSAKSNQHLRSQSWLTSPSIQHENIICGLEVRKAAFWLEGSRFEPDQLGNLGNGNEGVGIHFLSCLSTDFYFIMYNVLYLSVPCFVLIWACSLIKW